MNWLALAIAAMIGVAALWEVRLLLAASGPPPTTWWRGVRVLRALVYVAGAVLCLTMDPRRVSYVLMILGVNVVAVALSVVATLYATRTTASHPDQS